VIRTVLQYALVGPLSILLFLAIAGAVGVLVSALLDAEQFKQVFKGISAFGAAGFFLLIISPWGRGLRLISKAAADSGAHHEQLKDKTNA
jgi:hypothetical protein